MRSLRAGRAPQFALVMAIALSMLLGLVPEVSASSGLASPQSKVTVLANNQDYPLTMTVSGGYVYFWDNGNGYLNRVPTSGGKVQTLVKTSPSTDTGGIVVYNGEIYWTHTTDSTFWLYKTDLRTLKTETIYTGFSFPFGTGPFAVNGDHAYFVLNFSVYSIDLNGSGLEDLASGLNFCPLETAYSGGYVYWLNCTGQVGSVPASGGKATFLSPALPSNATEWVGGTTLMVVIGSHLYWTYNGYINSQWNSSVDTVSTSGNGFKILHSAIGQFFAGVGYSHGEVIWANTEAIQWVSDHGGAVHKVVQYPAVNFEIVAGTIYLTTDNPNGTVAKTPV